jgi:hypothetical protein
MDSVEVENIIKHLYTLTGNVNQRIDDTGNVIYEHESILSLMLKNAKIEYDKMQKEQNYKDKIEWDNAKSESAKGNKEPMRKYRNKSKLHVYEHYIGLCILSKLIKKELTPLNRHNILAIINLDKTLHAMFSKNQFQEHTCDHELIENKLQGLLGKYSGFYMGYGHDSANVYKIDGKFTENEFYEHMKPLLDSHYIFQYEQNGCVADGPSFVVDE